MYKLILVLSLTAAGCIGGGDDFDCRDTSGIWRFEYRELNGGCGPFADETISFDSATDTNGCVVYSNNESDDECRSEFDVECPLEGGGTLRLVGVTEQFASEEAEGTWTFTYDAPTLACRSTYDVTITKL